MIKAVGAFYLLFYSNLGIFLVYFPKFIGDNGFSSIQTGVIISAIPFVRFLIPIVIMRFFKLNFTLIKTCIILNLIANVLLYLSYNSFWALLFVIIIFSFSFYILLPYIEAIGLEYVSKGSYGKVRLFGSLGFTLMVIAFPYVEHIHLSILHLNLITASLTTICTFGIIKYEQSLNKNTTETPATTAPTSPASKKFDFSVVPFFWSSMILLQTGFGLMYTFFTIYAVDRGISLELVGYVTSFGVLCEIAMLYYQKPLLERFNLVTLIKLGTFFSIIRFALLFLFPTKVWILFIAQGLHAFTFALYHSACVFYLYEQYKGNPMAQQFLIGVGYGFGSFLGALIGGVIYGDYIFLYAMVLAVIAFMLLFKAKAVK